MLSKDKFEEIIVSTRSKSKLLELKEIYPEINIAENNKDLAKKAKYIFICVKQPEVKGVLDEIKEFLDHNKHVISLAGAITIENREEDFPFAVEIKSCAPGFLASIFNGLMHEVKDILIYTIYSTAKLIYNMNLTFEDII
ncbi:MAG: pyrroline-5-carboxylate reductase family protein [Dictyoglomus sp.]